jgi:hypothetical protein
MIMFPINHMFDDTPMEQMDILICDTEVEDRGSSCVEPYTPYRISTWNFGYHKPGSPHIVNMCLHELSHIVEFFIRDEKQRLLHNNYGFAVFTADSSDTLFTRSAAHREIRVLRIHDTLVQLFPEAAAVRPSPHHGIWQHFRSRGLVMSLDEWTRKVTKKPDHSLDFLCDAFQRAISFIRANR